NRDELPAAYRGFPDETQHPTSWFNAVVSINSGIGLLISPPIGRSSSAYISSSKLFICPSHPMEGQTQPGGSDDFLWNSRASGPRPPITDTLSDLGSMSYHYTYVPKGGDY